jgi:ATP-dependent protease Clp ATPase subunit
MYSLPSENGLLECVINAAVVEKHKPPMMIYETDAASNQ